MRCDAMMFSANNNNNKRRHVPSTTPETVFRILCPASKTGDLAVLAADGAKILVDDYAGGGGGTTYSDDRVVVVVGTADQPVASGGDESSAQVALIRVFERMSEEDEENHKDSNSMVTCRLLAPSYQVGSVLGRGGKIVEKIRHESGAQVRVLPKDQPPLPPPGDEFIQITGNFDAVKKALLSVTSCLQDSAANSGSFKLSGGAAPPAQVEPFPQRGPYAPDHHSRGYSSFPGPEGAGPAHHRGFVEEEVVFKLLCHQDKVGSLIGKGGSVVRAMQNETGASIQIVDVGPDSDERVVVISARENSEQKHSPAQDAVIRVHCRLTEIGFEPSNAIVARLLVRSPQVGSKLYPHTHCAASDINQSDIILRASSHPNIESPRCWLGSPASSAVADSKVKVSLKVSFMFEQATIHLGAIELLGEYFSSRKNYRPSPERVSCMHCETYHIYPEFSGCGWPPSIIVKGKSSTAQAASEANIKAAII